MMDQDIETNPFTALADAMEALAPPPCETIGPNGTKCPLYATCATKFLACPEYFYYVHDTRAEGDVPSEILDALPSREVYDRVYCGEARPSLYATTWLSEEDKILIRSETGTTRDVALKYRCSDGQVRVIRGRDGRSRVSHAFGRVNSAASIYENGPRMGSVWEASGL